MSAPKCLSLSICCISLAMGSPVLAQRCPDGMITENNKKKHRQIDAAKWSTDQRFERCFDITVAGQHAQKCGDIYIQLNNSKVLSRQGRWISFGETPRTNTLCVERDVAGMRCLGNYIDWEGRNEYDVTKKRVNHSEGWIRRYEVLVPGLNKFLDLFTERQTITPCTDISF